MTSNPVDKVHQYTEKAKGGGWSASKDLLRYLRHSRQRFPELVLKYGVPLVENYSSKLGSEFWEYFEMVLIAAFDCGDEELSKKYLEKIKKQFPGSLRVKKLVGMHLESQGKFSEAAQQYTAILKESPTDAFSMKRQVSIFKAKGDFQTAVDLFNTYLQIFMSDVEAWGELANLHLSMGNYKLAAVCYEELILSAPQNYLYYSKYAEIVYTIGGIDNYRLARKYFSHSLSLNDKTNTRALMGIAVCSYAIASHSHKESKNKDEGKDISSELFGFVQTRLEDIYSTAGETEKTILLDGVLERMSGVVLDVEK